MYGQHWTIESCEWEHQRYENEIFYVHQAVKSLLDTTEWAICNQLKIFKFQMHLKIDL